MRTINNILNGETSYYSCYDEYEQVESDYIYSEYKQFISKDKLLMAFKCSNSYDLIESLLLLNADERIMLIMNINGANGDEIMIDNVLVEDLVKFSNDTVMVGEEPEPYIHVSVRSQSRHYLGRRLQFRHLPDR